MSQMLKLDLFDGDSINSKVISFANSANKKLVWSAKSDVINYWAQLLLKYLSL